MANIGDIFTGIGDFLGGKTETTTKTTSVTNTPLEQKGLSTGAIVGIAVGGIAIIGLVILLMSGSKTTATATTK